MQKERKKITCLEEKSQPPQLDIKWSVPYIISESIPIMPIKFEKFSYMIVNSVIIRHTDLPIFCSQCYVFIMLCVMKTCYISLAQQNQKL